MKIGDLVKVIKVQSEPGLEGYGVVIANRPTTDGGMVYKVLLGQGKLRVMWEDEIETASAS